MLRDLFADAPVPAHDYYDEHQVRLIIILAALQCTIPDIAWIVGTHPDTLRRYGRDLMRIGRAYGRAHLRAMQYRMAPRSAAVAIWLGKQYLGQREPNETSGTAHARPVQIRIVPHDDHDHDHDPTAAPPDALPGQ